MLRFRGTRKRKAVAFGIRFCRKCSVTDANGAPHPKHWHRDVNAAKNMITIYNSLAEHKTRPVAFRLA